MSFFNKEDTMQFDEELLKKSVSESVARINDIINEYYEKWYIKPEDKICESVYNNLIKAFESYGKYICFTYNKEGLFKEINKDFENEGEMILQYLREAVAIVEKHYSCSLADGVQNLIIDLRGLCYRRLDSVYEEINNIKCRIAYYNYLENHTEYNKIKILVEITKIFYRDISYVELKRMHEFFGANFILKNIESELSVIPEIEDKYLRSTLLEFLKDFIILDKIEIKID